MAIELADNRDSAPQKWHIMAAYLLVQFAAWLALLTPLVITMALKISDITDQEHKAGWLGLILGVGAAFAMISAPVWGAISDRTRSRIGKRKVWVMVGAASLLAGLSIMAMAPTPLVLGLGWLVCQIGSNAGQAALNAVMSDIVPERQRGLMSALLGASTTLAMMTGVILVSWVPGNPLAMFLAPWLLLPFAVALFVIVVPDSPVTAVAANLPAEAPSTRAKGLNPLRHIDFRWAFISRFMVMFAWSFSMTYQVYYLTDHLHVPKVEVAQFMTTSTTLMGLIGLAVSCAGGWFSDRSGRRKPFVGCAAVAMAGGLIGIATSHDFTQFLLSVALVSLGQGLYFAVDIALCVAVLPNRDDAARDLAVLQIANSLPQSLAPTVAPIILGIGTAAVAGSNYPMLFYAAAGFALLGAAAIMPIRGVR